MDQFWKTNLRQWICVFLVLRQLIVAQTTPRLSRAQTQEISTLVERVMACRRIPGMNLAVVNKDEIFMTKGFGFANLDTEELATEDTLFPIASTTKAFAVTLLAQILHSEVNKNFTWDTPIKQILGDDFQLYDEYSTQKVTLRDILSHRTGIPDYFLGLMAGFPDSETMTKLVRRLRYHRPEAEFRTRLVYNNYLYALAGYVSEKLMSGTKWEELLSTHLLEPLGMESTTTGDRIEDWTSVASPYVLHDNELHPVAKELVKQAHPVGPAGSIISTAKDMAKWLQFHLNEGAIDGQQLLPKNSLQETYTANMPASPPLNKRDITKPTYPVTDVSMSYDMAWQTNYYRGFKKIWHSGSISTYKSQAWFFPELGFGMYCTCSGPPNEDSSWGLLLILYHISDVLMGETPWVNAEGACSFPAPYEEESETSTRSAAPLLPQDTPEKSLKKYTGTFNHPGFGDIEITKRKLRLTGGSNIERDQLFLSMGRFLRAYLFYNSTEDVFYTNLTGVYWYLDDRIPVRFQSSGNDIDILEIPMHSPFASTIPFAFMRGNAQAQRLSSEEQNQRLGCSSDLSINSFSWGLFVLNSFVIFTLHLRYGS